MTVKSVNELLAEPLNVALIGSYNRKNLFYMEISWTEMNQLQQDLPRRI
jgi:hypothetical protein